MRTIIELPEDQIEALGHISSQEKISRAEIIRRAVKNFLQQQRVAHKTRNAFGLWKKKKINSLKYERRLREEWEK